MRNCLNSEKNNNNIFQLFLIVDQLSKIKKHLSSGFKKASDVFCFPAEVSSIRTCRSLCLCTLRRCLALCWLRPLGETQGSERSLRDLPTWEAKGGNARKCARYSNLFARGRVPETGGRTSWNNFLNVFFSYSSSEHFP